MSKVEIFDPALSIEPFTESLTLDFSNEANGLGLLVKE
jgi:hypothetical protein